MKKNYIWWIVGLVVVYLVWKNYKTSTTTLSATSGTDPSYASSSLQDDGLDLVQEGLASIL